MAEFKPLVLNGGRIRELGAADNLPNSALDPTLEAIGGLSESADTMPYFTGAGAAALTGLSAFARSLLDDADAATARATLGLGTMAIQAANAVAIAGGAIDNTAVGAVTPAAGTFTTADVTTQYNTSTYQAMQARDYGYSGTYTAIRIGSAGSARGTVALSVDPFSIVGGNFAGTNQVLIPRNGILAPNAAGTDWLGCLAYSGDSLLIGPANTSGITSGPLTISSTGASVAGNLGVGVTPTGDNKLQIAGGTYSGAAYGSIAITGTTTPAKMLELALNETTGMAYLNAVHSGVGGLDLTINPNGGDVLIGGGELLLGGSSNAALDGVFGQVIGSPSKTSAGLALETQYGQWLVYTMSTDSLIFWDSGANTQRMELSNTGSLGIGVSPTGTTTLQVVGPTTNIGYFIDTGTYGGGYLIGTDGSGAVKHTATWFTSGVDSYHTWYTTTAAGTQAEKLRLDVSGNLGIGGTPSSWHSNFRALEGLYGAVVFDDSNGYSELLNNAYASAASTYTYKSSLAATRYSQQLGVHKWQIAGAGTAGNPITWTDALTLDSSGNLIQMVNTTAATLGTNSTLTLYRIDDTHVGIAMRGSDGTTRTASITVA